MTTATFTTDKGSIITVTAGSDGGAIITANGNKIAARVSIGGQMAPKILMSDGRLACVIPADAYDNVKAVMKEAAANYVAANETLSDRIAHAMHRADSDL